MKLSNMLSSMMLFSALFVFVGVTGTAVASSKSQSAELNREEQILNGKATIKLPDGFKKMTRQEIVNTYPEMNPKPQEVWYKPLNKDLMTIIIMPNELNKILDDSVIPKLGEILKQQLIQEKVKPTLTSKEVNGHTVSRLEFSGAPDMGGKGDRKNTHSIMQISSFQKTQMLIVTLVVPLDMKDEYLAQGVAVLDSLNY